MFKTKLGVEHDSFSLQLSRSLYESVEAVAYAIVREHSVSNSPTKVKADRLIRLDADSATVTGRVRDLLWALPFSRVGMGTQWRSTLRQLRRGFARSEIIVYVQESEKEFRERVHVSIPCWPVWSVGSYECSCICLSENLGLIAAQESGMVKVKIIKKDFGRIIIDPYNIMKVGKEHGTLGARARDGLTVGMLVREDFAEG